MQIKEGNYGKKKTQRPFTGTVLGGGYRIALQTARLRAAHGCQIGDLAHARITMNSRVLWSVQRIKEYLYEISC